MSIIIRSDEPVKLSLMENDIERSVAQNIALLISTKQGTCVGYRDYGMPMRYLNKPFPVAETLIASEIENAIEEFEPRASVRNIEVLEETDEFGKPIVSVEVELNE
ncbi:MAG: GPW/gp25 family protein [Acutalibacteraceae bacterium]